MEDKSILNIDTRNKRLLIRADLNVPINIIIKFRMKLELRDFAAGFPNFLKKMLK